MGSPDRAVLTYGCRGLHIAQIKTVADPLEKARVFITFIQADSATYVKSRWALRVGKLKEPFTRLIEAYFKASKRGFMV